MEITVATFNLRNFTARDGENAWAARVPQVAEMMRRTGAAVIGTQEGYEEMLTELAGALPQLRWVGMGRRGDRQDEFCAVFYRPDLVALDEVGHFWLSETPDVPGSSSWASSLPRMCTWVRLELAGRPLLLYNTHLDHLSAEAREQGIRLICHRIGERRFPAGPPALLLGDLNAGLDSGVVRFLRQESGLVDAYSALPGGGPIGATFHGFHGGEAGGPIDYIFGTGDLTFRATAIRRERIDGRYPSDHYPVVTTVQLPD